MEAEGRTLVILGQVITPETVQAIIRRAAAVPWGTHLLRWRYFEVTHAGVTYHRDTLLPTALWHLLKRVYVDQEWPPGTTLAELNAAASGAIEDARTEIYVYGYYRTEPPRVQWGFFHPPTGIAVVYDAEADLVATVFRPEEGARFFQRQIAAVRIDREGWQV